MKKRRKSVATYSSTSMMAWFTTNFLVKLKLCSEEAATHTTWMAGKAYKSGRWRTLYPEKFSRLLTNHRVLYKTRK